MTNPFTVLIVTVHLLCVTLTSASMAEPQCHSNDRYHVVAEPYPDDAGNRFAVTRLEGRTAPATCVFDLSAADLTIGQKGDPLWLGQLSGDSLILSRSTGPQGDLVVYDLRTGQPLLDVPADEYELNGNLLSFWQRTARATATTCPSFAENQANGLGSVTAVLKTLDLATKRVADTGESKCVAVQ
jgi:hypothetical protein